MKKILFSALMLSFSVSAFAEGTFTFPESKTITGLYQVDDVTGYEVQVKEPNCPPSAMCAPEVVLKARVILACLDRLGPVTYNVVKRQNGKKEVNVSVLAYSDSRSTRARCTMANVKSFSIPLGAGLFGKDDVKLNVLKGSANSSSVALEE